MTDKEKAKIEVCEVVTQTEKAFKLPTGEAVDLHTYLVWLGNEVLSIKERL